MARFMNKTEARAFAAMMREIEEDFNFINPNGAIRTGCIVEYVRVESDSYCVVKGTVIKHSYGSERGQHTFTIQGENGQKYMVKGRNLYPRLLLHIQGEESKGA